ncbi:MAG: lipopolysaccharide biosynthesis protein [Eubacteriaceae bacterium]
MNVRARNFIKNMSYTISSNLITLMVSTLVILVIPKLIGIEEYGYWQLYLFYTSYIGFLHFGWNDGIYLRFGGEKYENLNKNLFFSQFIELFLFQVIIGIIIWGVAIFFISDINQKLLIKMAGIAMILSNSRLMLLFILQATNRIKEYAKNTMLDRIVYVGLVVVFLLLGIRNYKIMILSDLFGKFIGLVFAAFLCREIVFNKISNFHLTIQEAILNISIGIKLMFANIASLLIIGIVRFGIERTWDIETFGKISLTLSISNMMMIFINAVGIIMFPILRRTNQENLSNIYTIMRDFLMAFLLGSLIFCYPLKTVMQLWLPQYAESLLYMALVFPIFIYEGKMALLVNTYLKALRKEKPMLKINVVIMSLSFITTYICTQVLHNFDLTIISIVFLLALRSLMAEVYLSKELKIDIKKDIILELILTIIFIFSGWYINSWTSLLIYGIAYIIYLFVKRKKINIAIFNLKSMLKV